MSRLASLLLVAVAAFACHAGSLREMYFLRPQPMEASTEYVDSIPSGYVDCDYHFRVELPRKATGSRWAVELGYAGSRRIVFGLARESPQAFDSDYAAPVIVSMTEVRGGEVLFSEEHVIDRDIDVTSDGWSVLIRRLPGGRDLTFMVGQRYPLLELRADADSLCSITSKAVTAVGLSRLSLFCNAGDEPEYARFASEDDLLEYLSSSDDPAEGTWGYLDRDTDPRRLNLGGDYRLATVVREDGSYDLIYLGGARVNPEAWRPMRVKGRLVPTVFVGHFDLIWYDAFGDRVDNETNADIIDGALMKLNFPLSKSSVRFRRAMKVQPLTKDGSRQPKSP